MTEPTYTIKPLVMVDDGDGGYRCYRGQYEFSMGNRKGWWRWNVTVRGQHVVLKHDGKLLKGAPRDKNEAVAALNAAYRRLLAEHLVEVK